MRHPKLNIGTNILLIYGLYFLFTITNRTFGQQTAIVLLLAVAVPIVLLLPYRGNIAGFLAKYVQPIFRHRPRQPVKSKLKQEPQSYEQGYQAFSSGVPAQFSETPQAQYPESSQFSEIPQAQYPEIPQTQ